MCLLASRREGGSRQRPSSGLRQWLRVPMRARDHLSRACSPRPLVLRPVRAPDPRERLSRRRLIAALLVTAAPAQARRDRSRRHARSDCSRAALAWRRASRRREGATFANESGNVVLHGNTGDYVIYWDPNSPPDSTTNGSRNLDGFGRALGEAAAGHPVWRARAVPRPQQRGRAAFTHCSRAPTRTRCTTRPANARIPLTLAICLTDAQLREQLQSFIATHSLPEGHGYHLLPADAARTWRSASTKRRLAARTTASRTRKKQKANATASATKKASAATTATSTRTARPRATPTRSSTRRSRGSANTAATTARTVAGTRKNTKRSERRQRN